MNKKVAGILFSIVITVLLLFYIFQKNGSFTILELITILAPFILYSVVVMGFIDTLRKKPAINPLSSRDGEIIFNGIKVKRNIIFGKRCFAIAFYIILLFLIISFALTNHQSWHKIYNNLKDLAQVTSFFIFIIYFLLVAYVFSTSYVIARHLLRNKSFLGLRSVVSKSPLEPVALADAFLFLFLYVLYCLFFFCFDDFDVKLFLFFNGVVHFVTFPLFNSLMKKNYSTSSSENIRLFFLYLLVIFLIILGMIAMVYLPMLLFLIIFTPRIGFM
jgi:hypothetical protein